MRGLTYKRRIRISENIHHAVSVADAPRNMAGRFTAMADMTSSDLHATELMRATTDDRSILQTLTP